MKVPVIDLGVCTECDCCIAVCPAVFRQNEAAGYMEVIDLAEYPEADVDEAIKNCPVDCITWEEE